MHPFAWRQAKTAEEAARAADSTVAAAMAAEPDTPEAAPWVLKGGGIDLVDLLKEGLLRPAGLVNLRGVPGLAEIAETEGGARVGAGVTLRTITAHPLLRARYPALAAAAGASASPEIRALATLGGNLLQRPRCWYFRSALHHCARKGGEHCFAFAGENVYHAVLGHDGCAMVAASTSATALLAYDATVELLAADGSRRRVPLGDFMVGPEIDITRETDLRPGEVLVAVHLPKLPEGARSAFRKAAEKPSFDWSIGDVAVLIGRDGLGVCRQARVALGAVAPVPWRARAAEAVLVGARIDEAVAARAAEAALAGAEPLRQNAYKVPLLAALLRRTVLEAAG